MTTTVQPSPRRHDSPAGRVPSGARTEEVTTQRWGRYIAAALRLSIGWVFLWAFLDKAFALGHETGVDAQTGAVDYFGPAAWIHGASPTEGFLGHAVSGPLADFYADLAGNVVVDWVFMLGLLGIGAALVLGICLRLAAASGVAMLVLMWSAVLPPANNPFMDDHLIYALVLVLLALVGAGRTFGFGAAWERLALVQRHPFLE
jgi:thiosulfate dehydrogenase [quinone] large subunit